MIRTLRILVAPLAAAAMFSVLAAPPAAAQQSCMSNRELQAAISSGDIAPVADVLAQAGIERDTEVLSVEVCEDNGSWAYYVGVIDAYGEARTLILQASG